MFSKLLRVRPIGTHDDDGNGGQTYHRFSIVGSGDDDLREVVFRLVRDGGWLLRELHQETTTLEDVFVEVVSGGASSPGGDV